MCFAEKDIAEKILEAYNDVFADIVNVLLFDGDEVVLPEELEDQAPRSAYKADGKLREQERDVAKRWTKSNIRIACVGLENQTEADPDMPLRVFSYDGAEYFVQMRENGDYSPGPEKLEHVQETLQLLSVMTGDHRFEDAVNEDDVTGGEHTMSEFLDRIVAEGEARGIAVGEARGEAQGKEQERLKNLRSLMENLNMDPRSAMDALSIPAHLRADYEGKLKS